MTAPASREDGWISTLTDLGHAGRDKAESVIFRGTTPLTPQECDELYHHEPLAARIVTAIVTQALQEPWTLSHPDAEPEDIDAVMRRCRLLRVPERIKEAAIWGRAKGNAALMLVGGGRNLGTPRPDGAEVLEVRLLEREQLKIAQWESDPSVPQYGEPSHWWLTPLVPVATSTQTLIHSSRLVRFGGVRTSRWKRMHTLDHMPLSVLDPIITRLRRNGVVWASVTHMMQDFSQAVIWLAGLQSAVRNGMEEEIEKRAEVMNRVRSITSALVLDAGSDTTPREDFSVIERGTITGIAPLLTAFWQDLSAAVAMPVTVLLGQQPAGLGVTGDTDRTLWLDQCQEYRTDQLAPRILSIVQAIAPHADARDLDPDGWDVVWPPWRMSEDERADYAHKHAQAAQVLVSAGIFQAEEIALQQYGRGGFTPDLQLDDAGIRARRAILDAYYDQDPEDVLGVGDPNDEDPEDPEGGDPGDEGPEGGDPDDEDPEDGTPRRDQRFDGTKKKNQPGYIQVEVEVTNKAGKKFKRKQWVRDPNAGAEKLTVKAKAAAKRPPAKKPANAKTPTPAALERAAKIAAKRERERQIAEIKATEGTPRPVIEGQDPAIRLTALRARLGTPAGVAVHADGGAIEMQHVQFRRERRDGRSVLVARATLTAGAGDAVHREIVAQGVRGVESRIAGLPTSTHAYRTSVDGVGVTLHQNSSPNLHARAVAPGATPALHNHVEIEVPHSDPERAVADVERALGRLGVRDALRPPTAEARRKMVHARCAALLDPASVRDLRAGVDPHAVWAAAKAKNGEEFAKLYGFSADELAADVQIREVSPGRAAPYSARLGERLARDVYLVHSSSWEGAPVAFASPSTGGTALASTAERLARGGKFVRGVSSATDLATGGAAGVFTRLRSIDTPLRSINTPSQSHTVIDGRELGRLDVWAHREDMYGSNSVTALTTRGGLLDFLSPAFRAKPDNEQMFPGTISQASIQRIRCSDEAREKAIRKLRAAGRTEINGRSLESFYNR